MISRKPALIFLVGLSLLFVLAACGGAESEAPVADSEIISAFELGDEVDVHTVASVKEQDDIFLLDVREPWEYEEAHIAGVTLLPMGEIASSLDTIPTDKQVIVTCRSGNRSGQVSQFLRDSGFDNISNMSGGIVAWQDAGYPVEQ